LAIADFAAAAGWLAGISNNCGQLTDDRTSPLNVHLFSVSLPNNCKSNSKIAKATARQHQSYSKATAIAAATSTACVRIVNCSLAEQGKQTRKHTGKQTSCRRNLFYLFLFLFAFFLPS